MSGTDASFGAGGGGVELAGGAAEAVTRACDELHLLYPTIEEGREGPSTLLRPSRFLYEIDHAPAVFERWDIEEVPREDGA